MRVAGGTPGATRGCPANQRWRPRVVGALLVMLLLVGCSSSGTATGGPGPEVTTPGQYGGAYAGGNASGDTEAGAAFARWVLEQDPRRELMTDAIVRQEQTLGIKVHPRITKVDAERLLLALAEGMARTFPGTPPRVIAYYQSGDKLAEATLDGRTNRVDVQFAR